MGRETSSIGASAMVVTSGVLVSRVFGLIRDVAFAHVWGTGTAFAAFAIAFTMPNLLRNLFGEGAFSAAFVPLFSERLEHRGREAAWELAQRVVAVLAVILTALVLVVIAGAFAALVLVPEDAPQRLRLTLELLPVLMPYGVLICLTGAFGAILNSLGRFALPAFTSVILNVVLIAATLWVCPFWGEAPEVRVFGLAMAVILAGLLQLGAQIWGCRRCGMTWRLRLYGADPDVRRMAGLMAPVLVGVGVVQLNVVVDRILAGWLGSEAVGALYYSQRLVYLPVGLFGVAMGVVALPALSRAAARGETAGMADHLSYALRHVLFMTLPVSALLGVLAVPGIRLLFQRGSFQWESTRETAWALWFYVPGIPAFACVKVAVTAFYARKDTRTPVRIAVACLVLNVVLNLSLMWVLRQGGLALATSICSWLNVALLLRCGGADVCGVALRRVRLPAAKILAATAALAAAVLFASPLTTRLPVWGDGFVGRILDVALPASIGLAAFLAVAVVLRCRELQELTAALRRRLLHQ